MPHGHEVVSEAGLEGIRNEIVSGCVFLDLVGFDALGAYLHTLDTLGSLYPYLLEIRKPGLLGLVLGVRHVVTCHRTLAANIATS